VKLKVRTKNQKKFRKVDKPAAKPFKDHALSNFRRIRKDGPGDARTSLKAPEVYPAMKKKSESDNPRISLPNSPSQHFSQHVSRCVNF
jgi:hypothetical protein